MKILLETLDYSNLLSDYEHNLLHQLRGFGADRDYMNLWVPSDDLIQSLVSLIYAIKNSEYDAFYLFLSQDQLSGSLTLENLQGVFGKSDIHQKNKDGIVFLISELQDYHYQAPQTVDVIQQRTARERMPVISKRYDPIEIDKHYKLDTAKKDEDMNSLLQELHCISIDSGDKNASLTLIIDPSSHIIKNATSNAADSYLDNLLCCLCNEIINKHVQDVYDNAVINLEYNLRKQNIKFPITGIILPSAIGGAFAQLHKLVQSAFNSYQQLTGYAYVRSKWYKHPDKDWIEKTHEEKVSLLNNALADYCNNNDIKASDIQFDNLIKNRRVFIKMSDAIGDKPQQIMALERHLKKEIDGCIEVYYQEMLDNNKLRKTNLGKKEQTIEFTT